MSMSEPECMLELREIRVAIGDKVILHDVNLRIEQGSVVILFGPNGCGKTSLLKAIMGGRNTRSAR